MTDERAGGEPVPISLVAHHVFCPRRAWLEAMGEKTDTHQMAAGLDEHHASDDPAASRARRLRAVEVASRYLGVIGRCDVVELDAAGAATVVEYKATPVRRKAEVTAPMTVQLALQAQALRESGYDVKAAAVYFTHHQVRVPVPLGEPELELARLHARQTAEVVASATAPAPLEDDPRCTRCSHAGICLPDERDLGPIRRRVLVADPDSQVLHLATPGSRAFIRSGRIRMKKGREEIGSVPAERVMSLVVHGNVDVSSALIRELLWRGAPILWCSGTGRLVGWAASAASPNGGPRVSQHVASASGHLGLAREFVAAKICNQATLLRRHGSASAAVSELRDLQARARLAPSLPALLGIEGDAAARYFSAFETMLTAAVRQSQGLKLDTRTRRPARDPVNAALNFCYGILLADVTRAVVACGLDPHAGFLHSSGRNKPALALDLSEEFRAPVADAVVIARLQQRRGQGRRLHIGHRQHPAARRRQGRPDPRLRAQGHDRVPPSTVRLPSDLAARNGDPGQARARGDRRNPGLLQGHRDQVSADNVHRFLIAYDIVSDHRRNRIAHTLESYGDRIQYSVFIVDAKPAKIIRLRAALQRHMDASEDHALICDLGPLAGDPRRAIEFLGRAPAITGQGPLLL